MTKTQSWILIGLVATVVLILSYVFVPNTHEVWGKISGQAHRDCVDFYSNPTNLNNPNLTGLAGRLPKQEADQHCSERGQ